MGHNIFLECDVANKEFREVMNSCYGNAFLQLLRMRNDFSQLSTSISELMTQLPEDEDATSACAQRYLDSFTMKEGDAVLHQTPYELEGEHKIEILGMFCDRNKGKYSVGNYNGYYVYWRLRPQNEEQLLVKHMVLHRFSLAKIPAGIMKVSAFNP